MEGRAPFAGDLSVRFHSVSAGFLWAAAARGPLLCLPPPPPPDTDCWTGCTALPRRGRPLRGQPQPPTPRLPPDALPALARDVGAAPPGVSLRIAQSRDELRDPAGQREAAAPSEAPPGLGRALGSASSTAASPRREGRWRPGGRRSSARAPLGRTGKPLSELRAGSVERRVSASRPKGRARGACGGKALAPRPGRRSRPGALGKHSAGLRRAREKPPPEGRLGEVAKRRLAGASRDRG